MTLLSPSYRACRLGEPAFDEMATPTISTFVGSMILIPIIVEMSSGILSSLISYEIAGRLDWRLVGPLFVYSTLTVFLIAWCERSPYAQHVTFLLSVLTT
ncbi:hypothetical protein BD769DRAFT_65799 [Suillus cothurnatus]|nr:hypothetical protein BD769DRAFT_65799 [Suillus cothurnatus]